MSVAYATDDSHVNTDALDATLIAAAREFGTPAYVYDRAVLHERWLALREMLPASTSIYYSAKANPNIHIVRIFEALGAGFEVASGGEIAALSAAGVDLRRAIFAGPGKSDQEICDALSLGVGRLVVESERELSRIEALVPRGARASVALRVNPGRGRGAVAMGGITQFGMDPSLAAGILKRRDDFPRIDFVGLHGYVATGILDWREALENIHLVLRAADWIQRVAGFELEWVDVGGGFGVPYFERDPTTRWSELRAPLDDLFDRYRKAHPGTRELAVESGRFLMGPAGVFLARVVDLKEAGGRRFAILDGGTNVFGMDDRYLGARVPPLRVVGATEGGTEKVTVCGPLCTSADRLALDAEIPLPEVGSLIAFLGAGAYGYSAARGLFLSHGFPREVLWEGGRLRLIRERLDPRRMLDLQTFTGVD